MFDYIYDNKLTDNVRRAIDEGKIKPFATDVQKQEIEKITENTRKRGIKQMAQKIQVTFLETSACMVGLDRPGRKGFNGSKVGMAKVVSDNDAQLLAVLTKTNIKRRAHSKTRQIF